MKFPYVLSFLVWRRRGDTSDNRLSQIEEYLRFAGFLIDEGGHSLCAEISNENPRFQDALKALGKEHQIEYWTESEKGDTFALCLSVSARDDATYEMARDEWKGLKKKYESAIDSIRESLEKESPFRNDKTGKSLLDVDFEYEMISLAGFQDKAICIKFSEEDVKHKHGLSQTWPLKIYGDTLFNESSLFIEIMNIPQHSSDRATDASGSSRAKSSRTVSGTGYFLQLRDDTSSKDRIAIFTREFLTLSRSLAKLEDWGAAISGIHDKLNQQEKEIQEKLDDLKGKIERIDGKTSNQRLRILERKKTELLSTIEELSKSVDICSRIEKSATNDIQSISRNISDFEMVLTLLDARKTPELPSLSNIWTIKYSRIRNAYDAFRHKINRTEKEVRDLHERAHLWLEDAQFELESARNRLLGVATLFLEAFIAATTIITLYDSNFDINTKNFGTIIIVASLVLIGLYVKINIFRSNTQN
jgi:DNA-binding transcriptional MerR regulator